MRTTDSFNQQPSVKEKLHFYNSQKISEVKNDLNKNNFFSDIDFKIIQSRVFDLQDSINSSKRTYLKVFDEQRTNFIAVEILIFNPYYNQRNLFWNGLAVWYMDDEEVGRNNFNLEVKSDWEIVEVVQSWGTPVPGFWKDSDCRVEILLENKLVCTHFFSVGNSQVIDFQNIQVDELKIFNRESFNQIKRSENIKSLSNENYSLQLILEELNGYVGLKNLKHSLSEFITYINFVQERKKQGIDVKENLTAHCIFLGNPGTGKTSIARILGRFFKSVGLLENGHVVEVDRSTLVGEYIGETAQKTEKVIKQALGGILFIDEAYTLKRDTNGNDFGQEAIDIILKRMEDFNGKFFVIAAGYPELMQNFLNSNPGLKSRFTHLFLFDDFSANELVEIYKLFSSREKFIITPEAEELLTNKLKLIYENDKNNLGNARFVRNLFNETKVQLSKRYHSLKYDERNFYASSTIIIDDILSAFNNYEKHSKGFVFNDDKLNKYLNELNNLVGLEDVKKTFSKLLASIKVEQLKKERAISSLPKNLNSIFICEPGAGTSTVARLFGKVFKELSLIEIGQLVEIDSSYFYGLNKIDSYLTLDKIFQDSIGKIIVVNDSVITLKAKSDFSDSLLQYFLKKLYLYKDKVVAVLTGNQDEFEDLFESVPVIENQFPNIYNFGHYSTRQLLEIALNICQKKNYQLEEGAWQQMLDLLAKLRSDKNKNFYNARTIKEILNKAIANQEERIISLKHPKDADLMTITYEDFTGLSSDKD
ncbi:MAG TPA: AAA family ATPase [Ignavibacteriaceae bacterium]|nr:AAA family ATPase [Ignavibacteriaceae bacterium]